MSGLQKAVEFFGSQKKLGDALGIHQQTVSAWMKNGIPYKRAKQIEKLTNKQINHQELLTD